MFYILPRPQVCVVAALKSADGSFQQQKTWSSALLGKCLQYFCSLSVLTVSLLPFLFPCSLCHPFYSAGGVPADSAHPSPGHFAYKASCGLFLASLSFPNQDMLWSCRGIAIDWFHAGAIYLCATSGLVLYHLWFCYLQESDPSPMHVARWFLLFGRQCLLLICLHLVSFGVLSTLYISKTPIPHLSTVYISPNATSVLLRINVLLFNNYPCSHRHVICKLLLSSRRELPFLLWK